MSTVPQAIIDAINTMLAPYGETYNPSGTATYAPGKGYMPLGKAAAYLGISKSSILRAVKSGDLPPPYKLTASKNGAAVYAVDDLDRFVRSHR